MTKSKSTANNAMEVAPKVPTLENDASTTISLGKETSPVISTTSSSTIPTTTSSIHMEAIPATESSAHAVKESTAANKDITPASKEASSATSVQDFVKPKVVDKIFDLPVVHDTYDALVRFSTPLSPYVEKVGALAFVVDQALDFKAGLESKAPEIVKTSYSTALNKVATVAVSLDTSLCSGVDKLVEKVPALKQATPALYNSTRESISSYATLVATYVASFTIAQVALKAADIGLETSDGLLKWTGNEKVDPILMGLRKVRSEATSLRKEGVNLNGTEKAKVLEEATLLGALMEIFCLGFYYNQVEKSEVKALPEMDREADIASTFPAKAPSLPAL